MFPRPWQHSPSVPATLMVLSPHCCLLAVIFVKFSCGFLLPCNSWPAPAAWKSKHPNFSGTFPT